MVATTTTTVASVTTATAKTTTRLTYLNVESDAHIFPKRQKNDKKAKPKG